MQPRLVQVCTEIDNKLLGMCWTEHVLQISFAHGLSSSCSRSQELAKSLSRLCAWVCLILLPTYVFEFVNNFAAIVIERNQRTTCDMLGVEICVVLTYVHALLSISKSRQANCALTSQR